MSITARIQHAFTEAHFYDNAIAPSAKIWDDNLSLAHEGAAGIVDTLKCWETPFLVIGGAAIAAKNFAADIIHPSAI